MTLSLALWSSLSARSYLHRPADNLIWLLFRHHRVVVKRDVLEESDSPRRTTLRQIDQTENYNFESSASLRRLQCRTRASTCSFSASQSFD